MSGTEKNDESDIIEAAVQWFTRSRQWTQSGLPIGDAEEMEAFKSWLAEDTRHVAAFDYVRRTFGDVIWASPSPSVGSRPKPSRQRVWAWGGTAAAAVAILLIAGYSYMAPQVINAATDYGESRELTLSDGSHVTLAAHSQIKVRYTHDRREVTLATGEAFFDVVHDKARPFSVAVGPYEIRDVGTQFNVDKRDASIEIAVRSGEVAFRRPDEAFQTITYLKAGDRMRVGLSPQANTSSPPSRSRVDALSPQPAVIEISRGGLSLPTSAQPGDWRQGRLTYANARLADIVSDINRYYPPGVSISDPALGRLRVTSAFAPQEIGRFLDTLPLALGVRVDHEANGHVVVAPQAAGSPEK